MPINRLGLQTFSSNKETGVLKDLFTCFENSPIPSDEMLQNLGLFISSKLFARLLFLHHIYSLQLNVHGVIMDFGTRWGQNAAVFSAFRGIYEPFNRHRKILAFDTFEGFTKVSKNDGLDKAAKKSGYTVTPRYHEYLDSLMSLQEQLNPVSHIKKHEIIKGDAVKTLKNHLTRHPETIVSLAFFDMDLYEPTFSCLNQIKPYIGKGAVIAFDEVCDEGFPGETIAFREVFGQQYALKRLPFASRVSYIVIE